MEVHDGRLRNKTSFFNRVYDCNEKSDCQSYSDTSTGIPLSTILYNKKVWIVHTHALIGWRHFRCKVPAGLLWLTQTFGAGAGGSGLSDSPAPVIEIFLFPHTQKAYFNQKVCAIRICQIGAP